MAIVSASPLLAQGLAAALSDCDTTTTEGQAEVQVLHARDAAHAMTLLAHAPPDAALVVLGDDLRELAARTAADPRPLALLSPDATAAQLRAAVAAVASGLSVRDRAGGWGPMLSAAAGAVPADQEPLTPRELEVFELLGKGLSNRDIGGVLGISAHTAKYHVGQILAKVGAATRAEAVRSGLQWGWIGL